MLHALHTLDGTLTAVTLTKYAHDQGPELRVDARVFDEVCVDCEDVVTSRGGYNLIRGDHRRVVRAYYAI